MENGPFEDVFPMNMVIFHGYVGLPEGRWMLKMSNWPLFLGVLTVWYTFTCIVFLRNSHSWRALRTEDSDTKNIMHPGKLARNPRTEVWFRWGPLGSSRWLLRGCSFNKQREKVWCDVVMSQSPRVPPCFFLVLFKENVTQISSQEKCYQTLEWNSLTQTPQRWGNGAGYYNWWMRWKYFLMSSPWTPWPVWPAAEGSGGSSPCHFFYHYTQWLKKNNHPFS